LRYVPGAEAFSGPLWCVRKCGALGFGLTASLREDSDCECLEGRDGFDRVDTSFCDIKCPLGEFMSKSTKFCGGGAWYHSFFEEFTMDFTGQGTLDPWRRIWYQTVGIPETLSDRAFETGMSRGALTFEWYLHAIDLDTGDPLFSYQQLLPKMLHGLHYDLDQSRIVGHTAPYWSDMARGEAFIPSLVIFKVNSSIEHNISMVRSSIEFNLTNVSGSRYMSGQFVTTLDSLNNLYYLVIPEVPGEDTFVPASFDNPDVEIGALPPSVANYTSRIYGVSLNPWAEERVVVNRANITDNRLVNIQANSRFDEHGLYALFVDGGMVADSNDSFVYVELGKSDQNYTSKQVVFDWTFDNTSQAAMKQFSVGGDYHYQLGGSAIDHYTETTFLVGKASPDFDQMLKVVDVRQNSTKMNLLGDWSQIAIPGAQTANLMNLDPVVPWLPPPQEMWTRFAMDGYSITIQFEDFTVAAVTLIDTDGDGLPDASDWSTQQRTIMDCSNMFDQETSAQMGTLAKFSNCSWNSSQLTIRMPKVTNFYLHDPITLKNDTIMRYVPFSDQWSYTAYGTVNVGYPYPLLDPVTIVRNFAQNANSILAPIIHMRMTGPDALPVGARAPVKLCEKAWLRSTESYNHGGLPRWTWTLKDIYCESIGGYIFDPDVIRKAGVVAMLFNSTRGLPWAENGSDLVEFRREILEPGCTYDFELNVTTRWNTNESVTWRMEKLNPMGALSWVPDCDWFCNIATCEPPSRCGEDGICICAPGIYGLFCSGLCPPCSPLGSLRCDDGRTGSGECICRPGFYGPLCRQRVEWRASVWSACQGVCNSAVGFQTRLFNCTNVETDEVVDYGYCAGKPDAARRACIPPPCPCGPPPAISGGDNEAIARECPDTPHGGVCVPICMKAYIQMGMFRCIAGTFSEIALCVEAGAEINAVTVLSFSMSIGGMPMEAADNPQDYIDSTGLTTQLQETIIQELTLMAGDMGLLSDDIKIEAKPVIFDRRRLRVEDDLDGDDSEGAVAFGTGSGSRGAGANGTRRKLQSGTVTLDLGITVYLRDPSMLSRVEAGLAKMAMNPGALLARLQENLRNACDPEKPVCIIPTSMGMTPPMRTQVYYNATDTGNIPVPTTTGWPLPIPPPASVVIKSAADFEAGLTVGFMFGGLFLFVLLAVTALWWIRKQRLRHAKVHPNVLYAKRGRAPSLLDGRQAFLEDAGAGGARALPPAVAMPALPPEPWAPRFPAVTRETFGAIANISALEAHKARLMLAIQSRNLSIEEVVQRIGADEKGFVSRDHFRRGLPNVGEGFETLDAEELFDCFDTAGLGRLRQEELLAALRHVHEDEVIVQAIAIAATDHSDTQVSDYEDAEPVLFTGHTRQEWSGGGVYQGQVVRGRREGEGQMSWTSGKIFIGQWRSDKFNGHGMLHASSERGCTYNGQFLDGQCHGIGRCEWTLRGTWYDGEWHNGFQHGMGEAGALRGSGGKDRGQPGISRLPSMVAHICRMEKGERQENLAVSHVVPEPGAMLRVELHASAQDTALCKASAGGALGELQHLAPLWGIAFGRADEWLGGRWGVLIITRILEGGALHRWSAHVGAAPGASGPILVNALIWKVNGISGDTQSMTRELTEQRGRHKISIEVHNPPCVRFPKLRERLQRRRGASGPSGLPTSPNASASRPWLEMPGSVPGSSHDQHRHSSSFAGAASSSRDHRALTVAQMPPPPPPRRPMALAEGSMRLNAPPGPPPPRLDVFQGPPSSLPKLPPRTSAIKVPEAAVLHPHSWVSVPRRPPHGAMGGTGGTGGGGGTGGTGSGVPVPPPKRPPPLGPGLPSAVPRQGVPRR